MDAIADLNQKRGDEEIARGHVRTAMNCWLRAADYYRQAEFWLIQTIRSRLATFTEMEACSQNSSRT